MELQIKNLGPIKDCTIDLSKDLILFTGNNNTGKTYLSYIIFGIARRDFFSQAQTDVLKNEILEVFEKGEIEIDLDQALIPRFDDLLQLVNKELTSFLPSLFSSKTSFGESSVALRWENINEYKKWIAEKRFVIGFGFGATHVNVEKLSSSLNVKITLREVVQKTTERGNPPRNFIIDTVQKTLLENLFKYLIAAQFAPAERIGIAVFGKDISLNKAKYFDDIIINTSIDRTKFLTTLSQQFNQYPFPIREAIRSQESSTNLKNQISDFADLGLEIEEKILNGRVELNNEGDLEIILKNETRLSLSLSGSNIKSLSYLTYFLKHGAINGTTLIIDEPEINLHPTNQITLARILAKLVNRGIKIVMSTHSDYMIREFNNLLMLGSSMKITSDLMERHNYHDSEVLLPNKIISYFLSRNVDGFTEIEKIQLENGEIIVRSINEAINKQNVASQDIYNSLTAQNEPNKLGV